VPPVSKKNPVVPAAKSNLSAVLAGKYSHGELNHLIQLCHSMAKATLSWKTSSGLLGDLHGLDRNDLAYDCIADLFSRDDAGSFPQLSTYFSAFDYDGLTEEEIIFHLQRLVSSKVEHGVVRLFQSIDPALGKILRNVKATVRSLGQFVEVERFGESYIAPALCDHLEHLPPVEIPILADKLAERAGPAEFIPGLMAKLSRYLREQQEHSRLVPTVKAAMLIRSFYERKKALPQGEEVTVDTASMDAEAAIEETLRSVMHHGKKTYVDRGKLTLHTLQVYCDVVRDGLEKRLLSGDGVDFSLFESLKQKLPSVRPAEYKRRHRGKLEYLMRLANKQVGERLK
jgi:hypothetical protein